MAIKIIIFTYLLLCLLIFSFQRKLQYFPNKNLAEPSVYGLKNFEEQILTTKDNLKITTWFKAPEDGKKIMVYFHGNGGNLADRAHRYEFFSKNGLGIMALSYQGYGSSEGKPTEEGLIENAKVVTDFLIAIGYKPEDMIFYGESLGSFVAVKHGSIINPYAIILEAPFYSALEIAQSHYWIVPVSLLMKDKLESNKYAPELKSKVLVFHGTDDKIIPISSGKKLFELFKSEKKFITVDGADHLTIADRFLLEEMEKFLAENN